MNEDRLERDETSTLISADKVEGTSVMKSEQEDSLWFGTTLCFIVALLTIIVFSA